MDSLIEKYPDSFVRKINCLVLSGSKSDLEMCIDTTNIEVKAKELFSPVDSKNESIVFELLGYESLYYTIYNPKKKQIVGIQGKPFFMSSDYVFAAYFDYGEAGFEFIGLKNPEIYFEFASWMIEEAFRIDKKFYFEFKSGTFPVIKEYRMIDFTK